MIRSVAPLLALFLSAAAPGEQAPAPVPASSATPLPADQAAMKAHVQFLASDAMKGREAGSPEFDIAAQYVAAQFMGAGLAPGGDDGGYLQRVPLINYILDGEARATLRSGSGTTPLTAADWTPTANPSAARTSVAAPVVFVGHGIVAPAYGRDDYAGVDVRGKVVAVVGGSPGNLTPEERAYFGSITTKATIAASHGAAGIVQLSTRAPREGEPQRPATNRPRVTWQSGEVGFAEAPTTPVLGTLSAIGAAKLFAGNAAAWKAVARTAASDKPRFRSMALPTTLTVTSATRFSPLPSSNVVGVLPGSDPALRGEVVVLSAHLDHIGVNPARAGDAPDKDRINNGALDDAIGIASLIEEAKRFGAAQARPRRTILFLAVTAEEKGLVGSSWFAHHPTVPRDTIVADVNLDMPILTYRFEDMVAFGGDRSTLGPIISRAASQVGVTMSPDPLPEMGIFVRSDHFNFVRQGIPSVFLWPGLKGGGRAATEKFLSGCYHKPCDDLSQPILWDQAVRFVDLNYRVAREIADADQRPRWNKGDYFGQLFGGPM